MIYFSSKKIYFCGFKNIFFYQHATDLKSFFHVCQPFVGCCLCCVVWHYMRPIIRSGSGPWIFIDATVFRPRDQLAAIEHILFLNSADVLIKHFFRPYDYLYVCLYARHKTVFRPTDPLAALDQMQLFIFKSVFFFFFSVKLFFRLYMSITISICAITTYFHHL